VQFEIPSRWECTDTSLPGEIWAIAGIAKSRISKKIFIKNILLINSDVYIEYLVWCLSKV